MNDNIPATNHGNLECIKYARANDNDPLKDSKITFGMKGNYEESKSLV